MINNNIKDLDIIFDVNKHLANGMMTNIIIKDEILKREIIKGFLFSSLIKFNKDIKLNAAYVIMNITDGLFYIGSSGNVYDRLSQHRYKLKNKCHESKRLQESFNNSYTLDFVVSVIFSQTKEEALDIEQFLLDNYQKNKNCINIQTDARSSKNMFPSIETKMKISNSLKGRIVTPETRLKIGLIHKGKVMSVETKAKMSIACKLRGYDPVLLAKMSNGNIGRKHTLETLNKKSEAASNQKKKVLIDGKIFNSLTDAAKELNIYVSCIYKRINSSSNKYVNYSYC